MEKDLLRLIQACVGVVVLLATAMLVFTLFPAMNSEVGAAWVQAIGAIVAILSGIAVVRYQSQEQARVRQEEQVIQAYRLLTSLRTEIELLGERLIVPIGKEIEKAGDAQPLFAKLHFVPEQFVVFDSHVGNFGSIQSDATRRLLIAGYTSFRGLLFSVERNTEAIECLEEEIHAGNGGIPDDRKIIHQNSLKVLRSQIQDRHKEAAKNLEGLKVALADDVLREQFNISDL
ncbi:hypothetical protein ACIPLR_12390 [Herbaspirillum huttiense]|uniref:hypothetical protein n=1 Tax=Herbaspirillum huttiense TaxID=863372 RepID=UPI00381FF12F